MLYFAYGSNLLTRRLAAPERSPSARRVAAGHVTGRRLAWDKVSVDGSGKCDAVFTGEPTDRVHGVVFEVPPAEMEALDRVEGVGAGYERAEVVVSTPGGPLAAVAYVATWKDPALRPYRWYRELAVAGAVEQGLPAEAVAERRRVEAKEDPVAPRRLAMEELLAGALSAAPTGAARSSGMQPMENVRPGGPAR